jgi:hypothetical protein
VIGDAQIGVYQTSRQTVSAPIGKQRGICIACICANDKEGRKEGRRTNDVWGGRGKEGGLSKRYGNTGSQVNALPGLVSRLKGDYTISCFIDVFSSDRILNPRGSSQSRLLLPFLSRWGALKKPPKITCPLSFYTR